VVGKDAQAGVGEGVMVDMAVDRSGKMVVTVGHERGITVWDVESATKKRKCVHARSGRSRSAWCTVGGFHAPGRPWEMALVVNLTPHKELLMLRLLTLRIAEWVCGEKICAGQVRFGSGGVCPGRH
jgi:hypothetical protein